MKSFISVAILLVLTVNFVYAAPPQLDVLAAQFGHFFSDPMGLTGDAPPYTSSCKPSGQGLPAATNVRKLHPSQVKVMAALGDSITAAFALNNFPYEYRDWSWGIGEISLNKTYTLFNLLQHQNPNATGGAVATVLPLDVVPDNKTAFLIDINEKTVLNGAISEAKAGDVFQQIDYLVWKMQNDPSIDFANDWKVVSLLIGANDLCIACEGHQQQSPEGWADTIDQLVGKVYQEIPRVFMNLVSLPNISQVEAVSQTSEYCKAVELVVNECGCLTKHGVEGRQYMGKAVIQYNEQLAQIADKYAALNDPGFIAVYQPALSATILPCNTHYLSDLDCFHPNQAAHRSIAVGIWNNMLSPPDKKLPILLGPYAQPICPNDSSFLQ